MSPARAGSADAPVRGAVLLGQGTMGRAYGARLREAGLSVSSGDREGWERTVEAGGEVLLLALRSGADSRQVVDHLRPRQFRSVVDLTTLSVEDAAECEARCAYKGMVYCCGGVAGGAAQVLRGEALVLLGPEPLPEPVQRVIQPLGLLRTFPRATTACAAKLLHNLVVILQNHVLGAALQLASAHGITDFIRVLELGVAGRPLRQSSVVRDHGEGPGSSYDARLVAKDVAQLLQAFPELSRLPGVDLACLTQYYLDGAGEPYTAAALRSLRGEPHG